LKRTLKPPIMSPAPTVSDSRPSYGRRILLGFAVALALGLVAFAAAVVNAVTLTRDAAALRNELIAASEAHAHTQVQVSAGPMLLGVARFVTGFISEIPPEARLALKAVRKASVGVYDLRGEALAANHARMLREADERMSRRGWNRVVAVGDAEKLVLIYMPGNARWGATQRVCLAVCDGDKLVVVAGTIEPAPLAELMAQKGVLARL
jgi:hypothetical protein